MRAQAKQLQISKDADLAKLAVAVAAGDEAAAGMLRDCLLERYPLQTYEFGTFMHDGLPYMVRTVSDYFTGIVVAQTATEILLGEAAWVPDMGRFMNALETGDFEEVEPCPDGEVVVARQSIVSYLRLRVPLPRTQK